MATRIEGKGMHLKMITAALQTGDCIPQGQLSWLRPSAGLLEPISFRSDRVSTRYSSRIYCLTSGLGDGGRMHAFASSSWYDPTTCPKVNFSKEIQHIVLSGLPRIKKRTTA